MILFRHGLQSLGVVGKIPGAGEIVPEGWVWLVSGCAPIHGRRVALWLPERRWAVIMIRFTAVLVALSLTGSSVAAMACESWCGTRRTVSVHCHDEMPLTTSSAISGSDRPCVSLLRERALVRQDDRRISTIALLSRVPAVPVRSGAQPIVRPGGVNQSPSKPLSVLRL
jgi:hypothetical protein